MTALVATISERAYGSAVGVYNFFLLGARATRFMAARPFYWRDVVLQMDRIGVGSLPRGFAVEIEMSVEVQ